MMSPFGQWRWDSVLHPEARGHVSEPSVFSVLERRHTIPIGERSVRPGAERLFELISQRYERCSTIVTSNLPFNEWTATFGEERLTGALLDRLTHHVHILEINGRSYRLAQSKARKSA